MKLIGQIQHLEEIISARKLHATLLKPDQEISHVIAATRQFAPVFGCGAVDIKAPGWRLNCL